MKDNYSVEELQLAKEIMLKFGCSYENEIFLRIAYEQDMLRTNYSNSESVELAYKLGRSNPDFMFLDGGFDNEILVHGKVFPIKYFNYERVSCPLGFSRDGKNFKSQKTGKVYYLTLVENKEW